jgi:hypothetical protein
MSCLYLYFVRVAVSSSACPSNVTIIDVTSNSTVTANGNQIQVQQGRTYSCFANSSPSSSYFWLLNGTVVASGSQYTINTLGFGTLACRAVIPNTTVCSNQTSGTSSVSVYVIGECSRDVTVFLSIMFLQITQASLNIRWPCQDAPKYRSLIIVV